MQTIHKDVIKSSSNDKNNKIVATHLGRQIFVSRIKHQGSDKGIWLHWWHPDDEDQPPVKYGYFVADRSQLPAALQMVREIIEMNSRLELHYDQDPSLQEKIRLQKLLRA